jgi:hypothetical protein
LGMVVLMTVSPSNSRGTVWTRAADAGLWPLRPEYRIPRRLMMRSG